MPFSSMKRCKSNAAADDCASRTPGGVVPRVLSIPRIRTISAPSGFERTPTTKSPLTTGLAAITPGTRCTRSNARSSNPSPVPTTCTLTRLAMTLTLVEKDAIAVEFASSIAYALATPSATATSVTMERIACERAYPETSARNNSEAELMVRSICPSRI